MNLDAESTLDLAALAAAPIEALRARLGDVEAADGPEREHGALLRAAVERHLAAGGTCTAEGLLDVLPDGFGFLRSPRHDAAPQPHDVYVSPAQIRHLGLRSGHLVRGPVRAPRPGERFLGLAHVDRANDADEHELAMRLPFVQRRAVLPTTPLRLDPRDDAVLGAIARLAPWGRGHRVLVTLPADADGGGFCVRTAAALHRADTGLELVLLLCDQRPEVHAAAHRAFADAERATVLATTFDEPPARHGAVAELALAVAQRAVEAGRDVVLLCDSLTALGRADNLALPPSGRLLCAGCDATAVQRGKRLFAAARACEGGGTLSVIATATLDGTVLAQALHETFRHRGNSEVTFAEGATPGQTQLDVAGTWTRIEDLVLPPAAVVAWRRQRERLLALPAAERLDALRGDGPAGGRPADQPGR